MSPQPHRPYAATVSYGRRRLGLVSAPLPLAARLAGVRPMVFPVVAAPPTTAVVAVAHVATGHELRLTPDPSTTTSTSTTTMERAGGGGERRPGDGVGTAHAQVVVVAVVVGRLERVTGAVADAAAVAVASERVVVVVVVWEGMTESRAI